MRTRYGTYAEPDLDPPDDDWYDECSTCGCEIEEGDELCEDCEDEEEDD